MNAAVRLTGRNGYSTKYTMPSRRPPPKNRESGIGRSTIWNWPFNDESLRGSPGRLSDVADGSPRPIAI
jgi:hypothetical protein